MDNKSNTSYTIKDAAAYLGIDPHTLRTLHRKNKVAATLTPIPGINMSRLVFKQADLDAYKANRKQGFGQAREDGQRHRHVLVPQDKLAEFDAFCKKIGAAPYKPVKKAKVAKKAPVTLDKAI